MELRFAIRQFGSRSRSWSEKARIQVVQHYRVAELVHGTRFDGSVIAYATNQAFTPI
jgi:hypothetical protein